MKKGKTLTELKAINKNMFMALNQLYGFNFEKPFTIKKLEGSFTINRALKETNTDPNKQKIALLVGTKRNEKLYVVEVTGTGANDFNVELNRRCKNYYYYSGLDNCYNKSHFNDIRKTATAFYIIAQNNNNLSRIYTESKPDYKERQTEFSIKSINDRRGWICYGNKAPFEFDKSGYLLTEKRETLQHKANTLRKERQLQAFKASDNSETIKFLRSEIDGLKNLVLDKFNHCSTYEEYKKIYDSLSHWNGFLDCVRRFESLETGEKEKTFKSLESFETSKNNLMELIRKVKGGLI